MKRKKSLNRTVSNPDEETNQQKLHEDEEKVYKDLKRLRVPAMAESYRKQCLDPNADKYSFQHRLSEIVDAEISVRNEKKFVSVMKKSSLRYPEAVIDKSINDPARKLDVALVNYLLQPKWVEEGRNLLVTGATGTGKTWLVNGICVALMHKTLSVTCLAASTLLKELERAKVQGPDSYVKYVESLLEVDLLVVDNFGMNSLDVDKCRDMFELFDARDGSSTIFISPLPVKEWFNLFDDATFADCTLNRITDRAFRLEMNGRNMRDPHPPKIN